MKQHEALSFTSHRYALIWAFSGNLSWKQIFFPSVFLVTHSCRFLSSIQAVRRKNNNLVPQLVGAAAVSAAGLLNVKTSSNCAPDPHHHSGPQQRRGKTWSKLRYNGDAGAFLPSPLFPVLLAGTPEPAADWETGLGLGFGGGTWTLQLSVRQSVSPSALQTTNFSWVSADPPLLLPLLFSLLLLPTWRLHQAHALMDTQTSRCQSTRSNAAHFRWRPSK